MNILEKERKLNDLLAQVNKLGKSNSVIKLRAEIEAYKKNEMTDRKSVV